MQKYSVQTYTVPVETYYVKGYSYGGHDGGYSNGYNYGYSGGYNHGYSGGYNYGGYQNYNSIPIVKIISSGGGYSNYGGGYSHGSGGWSWWT